MLPFINFNRVRGKISHKKYFMKILSANKHREGGGNISLSVLKDGREGTGAQFHVNVAVDTDG